MAVLIIRLWMHVGSMPTGLVVRGADTSDCKIGPRSSSEPTSSAMKKTACKQRRFSSAGFSSYVSWFLNRTGPFDRIAGEVCLASGFQPSLKTTHVRSAVAVSPGSPKTVGYPGLIARPTNGSVFATNLQTTTTRVISIHEGQPVPARRGHHQTL